MNNKISYKKEDNIYLFKNNKYKTIDFYLTFTIPYSIKNRLCLRLLKFFLGDYSKNYPNKEAMMRQKSNLYATTFNCQSLVDGDVLVLNVDYAFVNPKFIEGIKTNDFIDFFKECFFNCYFDEKLLEEFKRNSIDDLTRRYDQPSYYANKHVFDILAKDNKELEIQANTYIEEIKDIKLEDIVNIYNSLLKDFAVDVFLFGDYDDEMLEFVKTFKNNKRFLITNKAIELKNHNETIEEKEISQSILDIVYETPFTRHDSSYEAYALGNILLGNLPTSLLFEEVREKLSLCYYINVEYSKHNGIVVISTAIDEKNYREVVKQVDIQIQRLINKDYDPNKLELSKKMIIDTLRSEQDDFSQLKNGIVRDELNGKVLTLEELENKLLSVSVEDISNVFKQYKHRLTYLLKGKLNEQDI